MLYLVVGTISITPTMLRLIPSLEGSDGRFVHTLDFLVQENKFIILTIKSNFIIYKFIKKSVLIRNVTHKKTYT